MSLLDQIMVQQEESAKSFDKNKSMKSANYQNENSGSSLKKKNRVVPNNYDIREISQN